MKNYEIYLVMYKPPFGDKYHPARGFTTLEAADAYVMAVKESCDNYYVDILTVYE